MLIFIFICIFLVTLFFIIYPILNSNYAINTSNNYGNIFNKDISSGDSIQNQIIVIQNAIKDLDLEKSLSKINEDEYNSLLSDYLKEWENLNIQLKKEEQL